MYSPIIAFYKYRASRKVEGSSGDFRSCPIPQSNSQPVDTDGGRKGEGGGGCLA